MGSVGSGVLVQAVHIVSHAVGQTEVPVWLQYVQATATVLAVLVAAGAAMAAWKSASAASEASRATRDATKYERLRDLVREFDEQAYFVRFWRLSQWTKDQPFMSVSRDSVPSGLDEDQAVVWFDALSMNKKTLRADMYALYNFAMRLNSWLTPSQSEAILPADVSYANDLFGPHRVSTFLSHRELACRLKPPEDRSDDYYVRYYGVSDHIYTRLVEVLLKDLFDRDRLHVGQRGVFRRKNDEVKAHVMTLTDGGMPLGTSTNKRFDLTTR